VSDVEAELVRRREAGEPVVLATVIRVDGEPPSRPGEKILLGSDHALAGTLGCSEFDTAARADAAAVLAAGVPNLRTYRHELGHIEVYLEPYPAAATLVVLGRTPVADHLTRWAADAGFRVVTEGKQAAARTGDLYVVHTDHDDLGLVDALAELLPRQPRFVGVMGSRRHTGPHLKELRRRGLEVTDIQTPVGLDIGARTAAEIAISILAGLIAARAGASGGWKHSPPT
jgi:xanthine dehydrogenase accessory factor